MNETYSSYFERMFPTAKIQLVGVRLGAKPGERGILTGTNGDLSACCYIRRTLGSGAMLVVDPMKKRPGGRVYGEWK